MADIDPLFELRNLFLVGNYQAAINEGESNPNLPERLAQERDVLVYRAHIAKGDPKVPLEEIKNSASNNLQAVRCLAAYMSGQHDIALASVRDWLSDPSIAKEETVQLMAATIFLLEGDYDEVMRTLQHTNSMECHALLVQTYLIIARVDLAKKELAKMQAIDDDATLTQLALAWVDTVVGGEKLEEAVTIYSELIEKWNPTPLLLNGLACCHLHMSDKKDNVKLAEKELLQALEKNPNDPDTLVNLVALFLHQNKPKESIARYLSQLKQRSGSHPWVKKLQLKEDSFDRLAARYSASVAS